MKATPFNIFRSIQNDDRVRKTSSMLTLDLYEEDGSPTAISDTEKPIEMVIPRDPAIVVAEPRNITANLPNTRYAPSGGVGTFYKLMSLLCRSTFAVALL